MSDQDLNKYYSELISRYLSGNADDAEVQELEAWVLADPENKRLFTNFKKAWILSGMQQNDQKVDVEQFWNQTSAQLFAEAKVRALKPNRRRWLSIAATIALLAVALLWFFLPPGGEKPLLVESGNTVKTFELPDGSTITLNQASTLSYVFDPAENKRKVQLQGDAFFEVARDEAHAFIISTNSLEVEVLGTAFYVDARPDQTEIQVMVQSGSVAVRSEVSETRLKAEEKAVFKKRENELIKQNIEDPNYLALKTNTLVFENTSLEEAVFVLNRHFNASITIENATLKNCEITATYKDKSLEAILNIIEATFQGITINRTGGNITLTGTQCE